MKIEWICLILNVLKLIASITDSGANIFKAVKSFPESVFKLPCAGHRLNLCVNDILKIKEVKRMHAKDPKTKKLREIIRI